jgi:RING-box protein 1
MSESKGLNPGNPGNPGAPQRVVVKKWNAVAYWRWSRDQDQCAICTNELMVPCTFSALCVCMSCLKCVCVIVSSSHLLLYFIHTPHHRRPAGLTTCEANPHLDNECSVSWGACSHAFHFHCITNWLKKHSTCPLDDLEWEFAVRIHARVCVCVCVDDDVYLFLSFTLFDLSPFRARSRCTHTASKDRDFGVLCMCVCVCMYVCMCGDESWMYVCFFLTSTVRIGTTKKSVSVGVPPFLSIAM